MIGVKINDTANRGTENNFFRTFLAIFQSEPYLTRFFLVIHQSWSTDRKWWQNYHFEMTKFPKYRWPRNKMVIIFANDSFKCFSCKENFYFDSNFKESLTLTFFSSDQCGCHKNVEILHLKCKLTSKGMMAWNRFLHYYLYVREYSSQRRIPLTKGQ